jgi:transposase
MAMGGSEQSGQQEMWIETGALVKAPGNPFYRRLNEYLKQHGFDLHVSDLCEKFYAENGRPGVPPPVYFRMLMIGYFEGLGSERGIAWRCHDSLSLREFLGYGLNEYTPDHSTLSRIRQRIDVETHREIFTWVLKALAQEDLLSAKTVGIDATTLEANAALRSIVRRDTGEKYDEFLTRLAKESGIETPTREDLIKLDKKRKNKGSNDDWQNPHDPDSRITKMKDGRTHLAHKAEHAVDMGSGAVLAVTLQGADVGDTTSITETFGAALDNLQDVSMESDAGENLHPRWGDELVADKGYHSNATASSFDAVRVRTYISEPDRGRRDWKDNEGAQQAVYANRRRIKGARGRRLMRRRGELIERSFAHCYETGAMRRTHLRGHTNILKRLLIHVAAFDLSLILRKLIGHGTPRELANSAQSLIFGLYARIAVYGEWNRNTATTREGCKGEMLQGTLVCAAA